MNSLVNVRDIVNHFPPKIATWLAKESLSTPTEQQILAVIIQNYDSLALKLQDNLDQYERYSEKPNHTAFFEEMVIKENLLIYTLYLIICHPMSPMEKLF